MKIAVMGYGTIGSGVVDVLRINEDKITEIAEMLGDIDVSRYGRDSLMLFLIREPANARQREILVDAVADKETYTRQEAAKLVKKMKLAPENYTQLENMLKYKKSDIRETVLSRSTSQCRSSVCMTVREWTLRHLQQSSRSASATMV